MNKLFLFLLALFAFCSPVAAGVLQSNEAAAFRQTPSTPSAVLGASHSLVRPDAPAAVQAPPQVRPFGPPDWFIGGSTSIAYGDCWSEQFAMDSSGTSIIMYCLDNDGSSCALDVYLPEPEPPLVFEYPCGADVTVIYSKTQGHVEIWSEY